MYFEADGCLVEHRTKRGHKPAPAEDITGAGGKLLPQRADHLSAIPRGIPPTPRQTEERPILRNCDTFFHTSSIIRLLGKRMGALWSPLSPLASYDVLPASRNTVSL